MTDTTANHDQPAAAERLARRCRLARVVLSVCPVDRALDRTSDGVPARAGVIVVWIVTGPIFHYSDTWQLVINTGTTIVTFLMVFLIQNTQNRDMLAVQLKLSELVLAMKGAENRFAAIEDLSDEELEELHNECRARAEMTLDHLRIDAGAAVPTIRRRAPPRIMSNPTAGQHTTAKTPNSIHLEPLFHDVVTPSGSRKLSHRRVALTVAVHCLSR